VPDPIYFVFLFSMHPNSKSRYNRILLKLSGEALMGEREYGIDPKVLEQFAGDVVESASLGVQIGIVVGGGNIFRGVSGSTEGISRVQGDQMGMLATLVYTADLCPLFQ
jgi:uridylate kinase